MTGNLLTARSGAPLAQAADVEPLRVVSYGGGNQSAAWALMSAAASRPRTSRSGPPPADPLGQPHRSSQ